MLKNVDALNGIEFLETSTRLQKQARYRKSSQPAISLSAKLRLSHRLCEGLSSSGTSL